MNDVARLNVVCALLMIAAVQIVGAAELVQKRENFDADPKWETFTTRRALTEWPRVKQDFGWNARRFPGAKSDGQIGGLISRSTLPASYACVIAEKNLNQRLSASGKFRVTKNFGNSGALFGWFNETSRGWRTPNSLVFRLDGNGPGFWVFYEYGTRHGLTAGRGCFEGDRYQTTPTKPFAADGAVHEWAIDYDPTGAKDAGVVTFTLDGKTWTLPLGEDDKRDGAVFNRFGILNQQLSGDGLEVWFSDLVLDGERVDLSSDLQWEARGAKVEFTDRIVRPFNDAGWHATARAGGKPGELGGVFWRDDPPSFYATSVGKLTLDDELFASGRIALSRGATDSGVYFGWFNAASKTNRGARDREITQTNSLAIAIEGPSRIGHYFRAACWDANGKGVLQNSGPILLPDSKARQWSLRYSPRAARGRGQITVTLDDEKTAIDLPEGMRERGATFDHFGFFNFQPDGHYVEVFVDDLVFSTR
ncbi:MAG TPA: hypothetical protein VI282_11330 [Verrucomicrobiae bacterium]